MDHSKKENVHRLMCHSTATAERIYEANLGFQEAFQTGLQNTGSNRTKTVRETTVFPKVRRKKRKQTRVKCAVKETGYKACVCIMTVKQEQARP